MTAPITPSQGGGAEITDCLNALLLIEHGLDEPMATRTAEQWGHKCAEVATLKARIEALTAALQMFIAWDDGSHEEPPHTWHDKAMAAARAALASGGAK